MFMVHQQVFHSSSSSSSFSSSSFLRLARLRSPRVEDEVLGDVSRHDSPVAPLLMEVGLRLDPSSPSASFSVRGAFQFERTGVCLAPSSLSPSQFWEGGTRGEEEGLSSLPAPPRLLPSPSLGNSSRLMKVAPPTGEGSLVDGGVVDNSEGKRLGCLRLCCLCCLLCLSCSFCCCACCCNCRCYCCCCGAHLPIIDIDGVADGDGGRAKGTGAAISVPTSLSILSVSALCVSSFFLRLSN